MIDTKRFVALAKKWQKKAAIGRRRISLPRTHGSLESSTNRPSVSEKGHFVVYSIDGRRFVVPLAYLNSPVFTELFSMSEEEFGLSINGPITLPCDAVFMDYILSLIQRRVSKYVEKALLMSVTAGRCSTSSLVGQKQQLLVYGF